MNKRLSSVLFSLFFSIVSFAQTNDSEVFLFDDEINYSYNFFEADKCFLDENFELAENYYQLCLSQKPDNPFVLYRLAAIYLKKNELSLSEEYIDKCLSLSSDNEWYMYLAGTIYSLNNHFDKAKNIFQTLINQKPNEFDFYLSLADVYLDANDLNGVLEIYDMIEKKFGIDEAVSVQKKNIYLRLNKKKKAAAELQKLVAAFPDDLHYKRLLADFYLQTNDIKTSISIYNEILQTNQNDGFSHIGLAGCYQIMKEYDKMYSELFKAFPSRDVPSDVNVNILVMQMQHTNSPEELDKLFQLCEILVKNYPNDPDVNTIYANFQMSLGNIDIARTALQNVIEKRKDKYQIWEQILLIDNQMVDWLSMFKHSNEAIEYFPNMPFLYLLNGISAFQLSKIEKAKTSLEFGYKIISKDDPLQPDFLSFLGEVNYKLSDKKAAYSYFDKLLEMEPDNVMVLNNYSYYLSLDKENLEKAEQMSFKTIRKEPENSTYLDTYAWILFKMENYTDALKYIEKAVNYDRTRSAVIIEHYGDILYFNNDIDQAIEQWIRASKIGVGQDNTKLNEKIANHKYIE